MTRLEPAWAELIRVPELRSARAAVRRLATAISATGLAPSSCRPLYLHGPRGTGKTTLATALLRTVSEASLVRTVRTTPAHDLDARTDDPADLYAVDLLIVEDIQFIPSHTTALLERVLDHRSARRRGTLVTAATGPDGLPSTSHRLTSRLLAGLVVPIPALAENSRRVILKRSADRHGLHFTTCGLRTLAQLPGGLRVQLGWIERVKVLARGRPEPIDGATLRDWFRADDAPTTISIQQIVAAVAEQFQVKVKDILGTSRLRSVLVPRQVAMYLARELTALSSPSIGKAIGGRDHTTVLHAVRVVAERLTTDDVFARRIAELRGSLS